MTAQECLLLNSRSCWQQSEEPPHRPLLTLDQELPADPASSSTLQPVHSTSTPPISMAAPTQAHLGCLLQRLSAAPTHSPPSEAMPHLLSSLQWTHTQLRTKP